LCSFFGVYEIWDDDTAIGTNTNLRPFAALSATASGNNFVLFDPVKIKLQAALVTKVAAGLLAAAGCAFQDIRSGFLAALTWFSFFGHDNASHHPTT
jgi:hypothetical protein